MTKRALYQIDMNTLEVIKEWESASEAATAMFYPQPAICAAANGNRISANGFYWCFVDDFAAWIPKERKAKKVLHIESGEIFSSVKDAANKTGCNENTIRKACTNPESQSEHAKAGHWKYLDN